jgi:AcrR family transcriptional regulator
MVSKQRARKDEDKQARRRQILETALALWNERTFATLTMAEVGVRCGLAKGTLYLYFGTKEELLLALLEELLADWFDALDAALDEGGAWDAARVAGAIGAVTERRVALTRLLAIGEAILEHNIAGARALAYKELTLTRARATGARIERCLPGLPPGAGLLVLIRVHALVTGLRQMADPAPVVRETLARPELAPLRVEFGPHFVGALTALLRGMELESASERGAG